MRFALIDEEKSHHPVSRICRVLGVTPAGYYARKKRPPCKRSLQDEGLKDRIVAYFGRVPPSGVNRSLA